MSPTSINTPTANIIDDNDLLGGGSPPQKNTGASKPDPFAFMKPQAQPSFNQPAVTNQNQNFELLDTPQQSQPFTQPVSQGQPAKKFNPFDLGNSSPNVVQNTNKPTSGLPGNFKKFQAASASTSNPISSFMPEQNPAQMAPTNQQNFTEQPKSNLDQLDDLLENFNGLDFGGNQSGPQTTQQNQGGLSSQNVSTNNKVGQQPQGLNNLNAQSPLSFNSSGLSTGSNQQPQNVGFQQPQTQGFQQLQNHGLKQQPQTQGFQQPQAQGFQQPQNQGFQQSQNQGFQQQPQNIGFQQNLGPNNKPGFPNQQGPSFQNQVAPNQFNPGFQQQQGQNQLNKGFSGAPNQQFYPQYPNQVPGAFPGYNANPQWNGGYPQQGVPPQGYNYHQGQNFGGYGQPQHGFAPGFNSAPQQQFNTNTFQGQPNMYGKPQFQGQQDGGFQGQYGNLIQK